MHMINYIDIIKPKEMEECSSWECNIMNAFRPCDPRTIWQQRSPRNSDLAGVQASWDRDTINTSEKRNHVSPNHSATWVEKKVGDEKGERGRADRWEYPTGNIVGRKGLVQCSWNDWETLQFFHKSFFSRRFSSYRIPNKSETI